MSVAITLPDKAASTAEASVNLSGQVSPHVVLHVAQSVIGAVAQLTL